MLDVPYVGYSSYLTAKTPPKSILGLPRFAGADEAGVEGPVQQSVAAGRSNAEVSEDTLTVWGSRVMHMCHYLS